MKELSYYGKLAIDFYINKIKQIEEIIDSCKINSNGNRLIDNKNFLKLQKCQKDREQIEKEFMQMEGEII